MAGGNPDLGIIKDFSGYVQDTPIVASEIIEYLLKRQERWLDKCAILVKYIEPNAKADQRPKCVVAYEDENGTRFLRYSRGPLQGFDWDVYGDDMRTPALALIALSQAPSPK